MVNTFTYEAILSFIEYYKPFKHKITVLFWWFEFLTQIIVISNFTRPIIQYFPLEKKFR